jgi:hypothetical protein
MVKNGTFASPAIARASSVLPVPLEAAAVSEGAVNLRPLNHNVADAALVDLIEQLREGDVLRSGALTRILKQGEESKQQQDNNHPQGEIAQIGIHALSFMGAPPAASAPLMVPVGLRPIHVHPATI